MQISKIILCALTSKEEFLLTYFFCSLLTYSEFLKYYLIMFSLKQMVNYFNSYLNQVSQTKRN